jgi:hypothetical protein
MNKSHDIVELQVRTSAYVDHYSEVDRQIPRLDVA